MNNFKQGHLIAQHAAIYLHRTTPYLNSLKQNHLYSATRSSLPLQHNTLLEQLHTEQPVQHNTQPFTYAA